MGNRQQYWVLATVGFIAWGLPLSGTAVPPLGSGYSESNPVHSPPATVETPSRRPASPAPSVPSPPIQSVPPTAESTPTTGISSDAPIAEEDLIWYGIEDERETLQQVSYAVLECPPEMPIRLDDTACVNQEILDAIDDGWNMYVDPDGTIRLEPPPFYDPIAGEWDWDSEEEPCNPNIEVTLKQAALAGSQITRKISDTQLGYPDTDPIIAVKNPQKDGYGGVCTIDIFVFDELWKMLGSSYEKIRDLIEALKDFSLDDLFGAGCAIINSVFGDLQDQLLEDIRSGSPLTPFEQFVRQIRMGFVAPLNSFESVGLGVRTTEATLDGVATSNPLLVTYVPGVGYLYMAEMEDSMLVVLGISPTPLHPDDVASQ